jgi:PAS domain S-box-containing protein
MLFHNTPIKRRLMLVILVTSMAVLALTWIAFVVYELVSSSEELKRNVAATARIIAANSTNPLMDQEDEDAREMLSSLRAVASIRGAALYDVNDRLLATYPTNAPVRNFPSPASQAQKQFTSAGLLWVEPIFQRGHRLGTLLIDSSLAPIYDRLRLYVLIGSLFTAGSFLVALFMSRYLQKGISEPILQLASVAKIVSGRKDYSIRAHKLGQDELGVLTDAFNDMLDQIQQREAALQESADRLRLALSASQIGTWDWHIHGNQVKWDEATFRQFGLKPEPGEFTFEDFIRKVHPEDRAAVSQAMQTAIRNRTELDTEFRVFWPDGSLHHLGMRGVAVYEEKGRPQRMVGVSLDYTDRKEAEAAHSLLAAIVESSDDAIVGKDLNGNIISWNAGAQRVYGYTAEEVLGRSVTMLTSPDRPDEEPGILSQIRSGSVVQHYETVRIRKNGQPVQIALSVSPIRNAKGQVVGVSSISRDISERKHAEEVLAQQAAALQEQAQLLELANVLARDLDDKIILWSAGMEQMYGWTKTEALGKISHDLLATEFPEPLESVRATLLHQGEWVGELIHRRSDGHRLTVSSRWVLHRDNQGKPSAILEINNDITERKQAEEEIRRLNAELEQRVQQRTAALSAANDELEAFTYSVSHDLRAPLRHIDAFARIIQEDMTAQSSPELRNYVDRIRKGTQTMGRLVDDLLKLSRVGRAQPDWQDTDLNVVLEGVLSDLKGETASRQIEWKIGRLPKAACDPGLIKQVFANLLSNAIKYTRPRSQAVIEVGQIRFGEEIAVFVRDNGVGFDMRYVSKLFGVFERLHRLEDFEGTGIGLATVRRIVQKHGGRVWAEAEPDKGAAFFFTLQGIENDSMA